VASAPGSVSAAAQLEIAPAHGFRHPREPGATILLVPVGLAVEADLPRHIAGRYSTVPAASRSLDGRIPSGYLDGMGDATRLATELSSRDPAVGLRAIASLRTLLNSLERLHVENARKNGWSWQQIAAELGVSKQAVHEKHGGARRLLRSKGR
jgi:hypothetical protein